MKKTKGFTLIELMIVVAIIGILAAVAIPKFADLITKANEGATKAALSSLRSALSIYYAENEGVYPTNMPVLADNFRYIDDIPMSYCPGYHPKSAAVARRTSDATSVTDTGQWNYFYNTALSNNGKLCVDCNHNDTRGTIWSSF